MDKPDYQKRVIAIDALPAKAAYKYEGCEYCALHNVAPGICDECEDESEFEPMEEEDSAETEQELYLEAA